MATTTLKITGRKLWINVFAANPTNTSTLINQYRALIDTGSEESLISEKVIADLKLTPTTLPPVGIRDAKGIITKSPRYHTYIMLEGHTRTFEMKIGILYRDIDIIIGMDILEQMELNIKGDILTLTT